jgi:hypothetical protein
MFTKHVSNSHITRVKARNSIEDFDFSTHQKLELSTIRMQKIIEYFCCLYFIHSKKKVLKLSTPTFIKCSYQQASEWKGKKMLKNY